jgi:hypothetical protein
MNLFFLGYLSIFEIWKFNFALSCPATRESGREGNGFLSFTFPFISHYQGAVPVTHNGHYWRTWIMLWLEMNSPECSAVTWPVFRLTECRSRVSNSPKRKKASPSRPVQNNPLSRYNKGGREDNVASKHALCEVWARGCKRSWTPFESWTPQDLNRVLETWVRRLWEKSQWAVALKVSPLLLYPLGFSVLWVCAVNSVQAAIEKEKEKERKRFSLASLAVLIIV